LVIALRNHPLGANNSEAHIQLFTVYNPACNESITMAGWFCSYLVVLANNGITIYHWFPWLKRDADLEKGQRPFSKN
jgi:hypothetical protein